MPELPEVETARAYVEKFCSGSTIVKCNATEQGGGPREGQFDNIVIGEDMTAESLQRSLEGRNIVGLKRRGKQMWMVLDKPPHVLFHFGMTGAFTVKGEKRHKFVKFKIGEEWPPRFTKLELQMSNGACLALTDPRRLARVLLRMEPEAQSPISLLGPDPITHPLTLEEFSAALAKPKAPIKAVLLDQNRVVSGVGNWVADEVCFQACVHPGATCNTLTQTQVTSLHTKLLSICREACDARADYTVFPQTWLFHHRWGKGKAADGAPCVSSGDPIEFDVVGGRTTAFVPAVQKKGLLSTDSNKGKETKAKSEGDILKGEQKGKGRGKTSAGKGGATITKRKGIRGKADVGRGMRTVKDESKSTTKNASAESSDTKCGDGNSASGPLTNEAKQEKKDGTRDAASSKRARTRVTAAAVVPMKPQRIAASNTSEDTTAAKVLPRKGVRGKALPATSTKHGQGQETSTSRSNRGGGAGKRKRDTKDGIDGASQSKCGTPGKGAKTQVKKTAKRGSNATTSAGANGRIVGRRSPRLATGF